MERDFPSIVILNALKSLPVGVVPKFTSVIVVPLVVPPEAPVLRLMVVDFESEGLLNTRELVAEVISIFLPLETVTLRSSDPS